MVGGQLGPTVPKSNPVLKNEKTTNLSLLIGIDLATNIETHYGIPLLKTSFAPAG